MSTVQRRRGKSLHLELPGGLPDDRPPIVALFLIRFDVKAGYTISWKRSLPDLVLSDSVEFKSLPSGLHNVKDDLVYFMHDEEHAGISAFVNKSTDTYERNALMLAVGALVPLENGRLGKSWKHADKLKELADQLVLDPSKVRSLEEYWEANQLRESEHENNSRPGSSSHDSEYLRQRITSAASGFSVAPTGLSPYHPALTLPYMIESFGPLIFTIYKAALLRKRILLMHEAPVQLACNFVYNISILSNIPSSVIDSIPLEPLPTRLQPLFSVGIHDIDELSHKGRHVVDSSDPGYGWVACSTDDVLTMKTEIYDIFVRVPPAQNGHGRRTVNPRIKDATGQELRASQRDLRRYRTLRGSIGRRLPHASLSSPFAVTSKGLIQVQEDNQETDEDGDLDDESATLLASQSAPTTFDDTSSIDNNDLIEPMSWSALAYNSFMWWASAGEKTTGLEEEIEHDASMFRDFNSSYIDSKSGRRSFSGSGRRSSSSNMAASGMSLMTDGSGPAPEMAIIAFFHRLTANIFSTITKLADDSDQQGNGQEESDEAGAAVTDADDTDDDHRLPPLYVGSEDLVRMGLDIWSDADKKFVEDLVELYWGRKADVQGGVIECCGMRVI